MRAQMPALDEDQYLPWNSGTPTVASLVTLIHVRIETPFTPDQATTVVLVAHPCTADDTEPGAGSIDSRTPCPPIAPVPAPGQLQHRSGAGTRAGVARTSRR